MATSVATTVTKVGTVTSRSKWTFHNWKRCRAVLEKMQTIEGPTFTTSDANGCSWGLELNLRKDGEVDPEDLCVVVLRLISCANDSNKALIKGAIKIVDHEGNDCELLCNKFFQTIGVHESIELKVSDCEALPDDLVVVVDLHVIVQEPVPQEASVDSSAASDVFDLALLRLSDDFGSLQTSQLASDITVRVGEEAFRCHKAVLGARSSVLRIFVGLKEVTVPDTSPEAWRLFQAFLYTAQLPDLDQVDVKLVAELLSLAKTYRVDSLTPVVEATLEALLTRDNLPDMFELLEKFELLKLQEAAAETFRIHADSFPPEQRKEMRERLDRRSEVWRLESPE